MKTRYRLIRRGIRGNKFYCVDTATGKRTSLGTSHEDEAKQVVEAKNNSERQPVLNLQIAKAYLAGSDKGMTTRTWRNAIDVLMSTKQGANQHRWKTAAKDKALATLLPQVIIETKGENLGHNSRAMARAYSRKAPVEMPALSEYERQQKAILAGPQRSEEDLDGDRAPYHGSAGTPHVSNVNAM
jgi:hypothetical protein